MLPDALEKRSASTRCHTEDGGSIFNRNIEDSQKLPPLERQPMSESAKKNGPDNSFEIMEIRAGIRTCDLQIRKSIFVWLHGVQMQEGGTGKVVSI